MKSLAECLTASNLSGYEQKALLTEAEERQDEMLKGVNVTSVDLLEQVKNKADIAVVKAALEEAEAELSGIEGQITSAVPQADEVEGRREKLEVEGQGQGTEVEEKKARTEVRGQEQRQVTSDEERVEGPEAVTKGVAAITGKKQPEVKKKPIHDYSSTQVDLPEKTAIAIKDFGNKIPESEIYTDPKDPSYGREPEPHITVRYGLDTSNPKDIAPAFKGMGPIKVKLGKVSIFESDKYDVVKVDIESPDLHEANKQIGETVSLPGETYKDYQPHATIAYVKKGEGKKYIGDTSLEGQEIVIDNITLSDKDGKVHKIPLTRKSAAKVVSKSVAAITGKKPPEVRDQRSEVREQEKAKEPGAALKKGDRVVVSKAQGMRSGVIDEVISTKFTTIYGTKAGGIVTYFVKTDSGAKIEVKENEARAISTEDPEIIKKIEEAAFEGVEFVVVADDPATKEQEELLINANLEGNIPASEKGQVQNILMTAGPAGGGKSTGLEDADSSNRVKVNADIIRVQAGHIKDSDGWHEQASRITKKLLKIALDGNYHVLYDSQFTNYPMLKKKIDQVLDKAGTVDISFTDIDAVTSRVRSILRIAMELTKRPVPDKTILKGFNRGIPTFIKIYEEYRENKNVNFTLINNGIDKVGENKGTSPTVIIENNIIRDAKELDSILKTPYIETGKGDDLRYERAQKATNETLWSAEAEINQRINAILVSNRRERLSTTLRYRSKRDKEKATSEVRRKAPVVSPEALLAAYDKELKRTQKKKAARQGAKPPTAKEKAGEVKEHLSNAISKFKEINKLLGDSEKGSISFEEIKDDDVTWQQIQGLLKEAWDEITAAGESLNEFIAIAVQNLGAKGRPYFKKFVREELGGELDDESEGIRTESGRPLEGTQAEDVPGPAGPRDIGEQPERGGQEGIRADRQPDDEERVEAARGGRDSAAAVHPAPERRRHTEPGRNYRITEQDDLESGGTVSKYDRNIAAIKLLKQLEGENRQATPAEQAVLVKYTGWGGLSEVFKHYHDENPWSRRADKLKNLLDDEEYKAARASTPNAFYTSPLVAKHIYNALTRIGFDGGRVLDPSMGGTGMFEGVIPSEWTTNIVGIELDSISGRIAKKLYPDADVRVQGYEDTKLPNDFFDLAISNVPFGDYKVFDPDYARLKFFIHDYFFAKSIDKVRPGGMIAFITSAGMMNKKDSRIREYISERTELIAAIRLPGDAFKKIANTEVTADIIFLRKLDENEKPKGAKWLKTGNVKKYTINEYFVRYPHMMLGKLVDDKLHPGRAALKSDGRDLGKALAEAIETAIPEDIYKKPIHEATEAPKTVDLMPAPDTVKNFAYFVQDGKVYRKKHETAYPVGETKKAEDRIKGLIQIRDITRQTLHNQLEGQIESKTPDLKKLNQAYDRFVKKYGYIHSIANRNALRDDPDLPLLLSLEIYDPDTKEATKTDIFRKATMAKFTPVEKVENAQDALVASMFERGRIDFKHMSRISGRDVKTLQKELKGLVYLDPEGGNWVTADDYLSGNIRAKLTAAKAAAEIDGRYKENIQVLETAMPEDILPSQITARLGMPWIPESYIRDYLTELLDASNHEVRYVTETATWVVDFKNAGYDFNLVNRKWGTTGASAIRLVEEALNQKSTVITYKDPDGKSRVDQSKTLAAQAMQREIKQHFEQWLWKNGAREQELVDIFNRSYNSTRNRKYDGSHLPTRLPGMASWVELRPNQKDAVWRIVHGGNTLLAHVVGSGKTLSMISGAMEMKRLGLAKKPIFVVPKHLILQWQSEFLRFYPGAKVLAPDSKSLTPKKRAEFMARIATGDWDAVLITHPNMIKLPMSRKAQGDFISGQIRELEDAVIAEYGERSPYERGRQKSKTVKELEKSKKRLEGRLKEVLEKTKRDDTVTFEELGIDYMFIDESHNFKNLWAATRMTRVAGVKMDGAYKTMDLFLKTQHLHKLNNGRGVVFATGTPISNSMGEMFTIQKYLDFNSLKNVGIHNFDAWASTFGEVTEEPEVTPTGTGFRMHSRFRRFINMGQLSAMFRSFADVVLAEDITYLPIPEMAGGKPEVVQAEASQEQKDYVQELDGRMDAIRTGYVDSREDNALVVTTDGTKAALDMRIIEPTLPDNPGGKVNLMVARAVDIYKATTENKLTQLIFCDFSVPSDQFNVYHDVRDKLIDAGVPKEEIALIHSYNTDAKKAVLFRKVNDGTIRFLMGSTAKMGEGMNVQRILVAIHDLDAPWRPSDVEQRVGRGIRPDNLNDEVQIIRYVTQGTYDAYRWQILENKAKFITQVMKGRATEMEDIGKSIIDYATAKAIAADNPLIMEKVETDSKLITLDAEHRGWQDQRFRSRSDIARWQARSIADAETITLVKKDIKTRLPIPEEKDFSLIIDSIPEYGIAKAEYADKKEAGLALADIFGAAEDETKKRIEKLRPIGEYRGFTLFFSNASGKHFQVLSFGENENRFTPKPPGEYVSEESAAASYITGLNRHMNALDGLLSKSETDIKNYKGLIKKAEDELSQNPDFPKQAELDTARKRAREIDVQLNIVSTPPQLTPELERQYYVLNKDKSFELAEGAKKVEIVPWLETFIRKSPEDKIWTVSEARSGLALKSGDTRKEAIAKSEEAIDWTGEEAINKVLTEHIEKYGESPWVTGEVPPDEQYSITSKKPWSEDFPNAIPHTSLKKLKGHPDYEAAKKGDVEASQRLAHDLVNVEKSRALAKKYPDAILIPALALEQSGHNTIPLAFAHAIADITGLPIADEIYQINKTTHTAKKGLPRLLARAIFNGKIISGQEYILIDDVITQGGTLSELRHFIDNSRGTTVAITTLGYGQFSTIVAIRPETIQEIERKLGREKTEELLYEYNIAGSLEALTQGEAREILRFSSIESLRTRILKEAHESGFPSTEGPVQRFSLKPFPKTNLTATVSLDDVRAVFKGQHVGLDKDGNVWVRTRAGYGVTIKSVEKITENKADIAVSYGKQRKDGEYIAGKYKDGVIELQMDLAGKWTLAHESIHFFEDAGIITSSEAVLFRSHIRNLHKKGKFESVLDRMSEEERDKLSDIERNRLLGGSEDRANFIADHVTKDVKGPIGQILKKINTWIARFVNLFHRTAKGVLADIESGRIFDQPKGFVPKPGEQVLKGQAAFTFVGKKAHGADKSMLAIAVQREKKGDDPGHIRMDTGWFLGMDDMWRFEIDDSTAKFYLDKDDIGRGWQEFKVGNILEHKNLYKSYPEIENIKLQMNIDPKLKAPRGSLAKKEDEKWIEVEAPTFELFKQTLLHEIQHAVQEIEGFARGGSPETMAQKLVNEETIQLLKTNDTYADLAGYIDKLYYKGEGINAFTVQTYRDQMQEIFDKHLEKKYGKDPALNLYKRLAGEIESRDVAARMDLTAEERRETRPYADQGIPKEEAIVRFREEAAYDVEKQGVLYSIQQMSGIEKQPSGLEVSRDIEQDKSFVNKLFEMQNVAVFRISNTTRDLQEQVQRLAGETSRKKLSLGFAYKPELKRSFASDNLDRAMMLYRDLGDNLEKAEEFRAWAKKRLAQDIPAREQLKIKGQLKLLDQVFALTDEQKEFVTHAGDLFEDAFSLAKAHKIVKTHADNYVRRLWKLPEGMEQELQGSGPGYGFKTYTTAAKQRTFDTILDGWMAGFELKVQGITSSYERYMTELATIMSNKAFLQRGAVTVDISGNAMFTAKQRPGYAPLKASGFSVWRWAGKAEIEADLNDDEALVVDTYGRKFFATTPERIPEQFAVYKNDKARRAIKLFDTMEQAEAFAEEEGFGRIERRKPVETSTMFEKQPLYAPKPIADMINKMTATDTLFNSTPVAKAVLRLNTSIKTWILLSSFFHHMAGTRSWVFGVHHGWKNVNPVKAYKAGMKKIEDLHPLVELGIKNGLTTGELQDWAESELRGSTGLTEKLVNYLGLEKTGKVMEYGRMRRERFTDSLFKKFFAGLKAEAFVVEYVHELQKANDKHTHGILKEAPNPDQIAERVALLINADFGGLHLKRMGRNPTLQKMARLLLLAPDWTESNFRTVTGMIPGLNKVIDKAIGDVPAPKGMEDVYRRFWGRVILRIGIGTIITQLLLNGSDETEEFLEEQLLSNKANKLRWTEIDVTKLYHMLGVDTEGKRKTFSLGGHFFDPLKLIDPFRLIKHKGSPFARAVTAVFSGSDWADRPFTGVKELLTTGKTVKKSSYHEKSTGLDRLPSVVVNQIVNFQPIQLGHLIRYMQGEEDGLTAIMHSMGAATHTAWKPRLETPIVAAGEGPDPVLDAIKEMQTKKTLKMGPPSRYLNINGISQKMTREQYEKYLSESSAIARRKLARIMNSSGSDEWKAKKIKAIINNARRKIRGRIKKIMIREKARKQVEGRRTKD